MGLGLYEIAKQKGRRVMNWCETDINDRSWRFVMNRKLRVQYMKDKPKISEAYKQEVLAFWKPYRAKFNPNWHQYYAFHNGRQDVRYIPNDLHYTIMDRYFNKREIARGISDKNYTPLFFPDIKQPEAVVRKINGELLDEAYHSITIQEAANLCGKFERLIVKPSIESCGGSGIRFWQATDGLETIKDWLSAPDLNLVVQKIIRQHSLLEQIHPNSVNTVRLMTFLNHGQAHLLSAVLRMGVDDLLVDNVCKGGITSGIRANGQLKPVAYSAYGPRYDVHPQGFQFENCVIPEYGGIVALVKKEHRKIAHSRLVSWDIAIDQTGEPILVEANLFCGGLDLHQFNNGPLFGELTESVLKEVFDENRKKFTGKR